MASPGHPLGSAGEANEPTSIDRGRFDPSRWPVGVPVVFTSLVVALVAITGVRGSDYPAHYFRAVEWRSNPLGTWNFQWYGGHSTFTYSVLSPPLSVALTPFGLCVASALGSVVVAGSLMQRFVGRLAALAGTLTVALVAVDSVIVGRVPFALGYLLMLVTLWLWSGGHIGWAAALAVTVGLASPVAAVMLGLVALPIAVDQAMRSGPAQAKLRRTRDAVVIGVATAFPLAVMSIVTARSASATGYFPFIAINIAFSVAASIAILLTARRRVVRLGAGLALVVTLVAAIVPNPLGGNLSRFTGFVLVPVATALAVERFERQRTRGRTARAERSPGVIVTAILWLAATGFAVSFSARTTYRWYHDPSHDSSYFDPLLDEIERWQTGRPLTRVEIPFTQGHMEAAVVAEAVPYARGWERQVDLERNSVLYDADLSAEDYRAWLDEMAVGLIAVPDVPLDAGGKPEAALVADGAEWLEPIWQGEHWRLYAVAQPTPLASTGEVTAIDAGGITFEVERAGEVDIAAVYDPRLSVAPSGCLYADRDGGIVARVARPGRYHIAERRFALFTGAVSECSPLD